ncbi:adenosylmethionine decarboxylase [Pararhizobium sp. DWP1-1-3]|uniref:adenosylmethionine decarboxylase n=1 Tax=Pararhizobium sp. DWP1-1-3 TaxID=2804652 RepID=UPI003CFB707E
MGPAGGLKELLSTHRRIANRYLPEVPAGKTDLSTVAAGELPGRHLIADFSGAENLDDVARIEAAFTRAIAAAGATLLGMSFHVFSPGGGVTGTASLAESHISIHTWPENAYAALDIFMCGVCDPLNALPALIEAFTPALIELRQIIRDTATDTLAEAQ